MRHIDIIIRVQDHPERLRSFLASLVASLPDVADHSPRVTAINPCWDRPEIDTLLLQSLPGIEIVMTSEGPAGVGLLSSLLRRSAAERRDAVVLRPEAAFTANSLRTLVLTAQASDGIGLVSPRSLLQGAFGLQADALADLSAEEAYRRYSALMAMLPAQRPTAVCLPSAHLLTSPLLAALCAAQPDPAQLLPLGPDLAPEARRWGYAALLANRALVHCAPDAGAQPWPAEVDASSDLEAMLAPLLPGAAGHGSMVVDWSDTGGHHGDGCGADVAALQALARHAPADLKVKVMCADAAFRFHGLDEVPGLERVEPDRPGLHAVALRMQVPSDAFTLARFHRLAPIGLCVAPRSLGRLETLDEPTREGWHALMRDANAVLLNSAGELAWLDAMRPPGRASNSHLLACPTALAEHRLALPQGLPNHLLVMGDEADAMALRLQAWLPALPLVCLGQAALQVPGCRNLRADAISPKSVGRLISQSHAIVVAGLAPPRLDDLLRVMASGKPLVMQRTAGLDEVLDSYRATSGVFLYDQPDQAEDLLRAALAQGKSQIDDSGSPDWPQWAAGVVAIAQASLQGTGVYSKLQRRLARTGTVTLEQGAHPFARRVGALDLDHLLAHEDIDFVQMAYWTFLNRKADVEGEKNFLYALRSGKTKFDIIDMIQGSPEGSLVGARLAGYTPLSRASEVMPKRIVLVLGMHRSGTSALTRGLQVLGVELGSNLYPPRPGENPKGYFEDADISNFDDRLLASMGRDWQHFGQLDADLVEGLRQSGLIAQAVELLRAKVEGRALLGVKDPRISKLLPFWQPVFSELGLDQSFVLAVRNPRSVARSLEVRNGFSHQKSYILWLDHTLGSLEVVGRHRFAITDYDQLLCQPEAALRTIARRLDLYLSGPALQEYASEFLDSGLRHAEFGADDLSSDPACFPLVREVYGRLQQLALDNSQADQAAFAQEITDWKTDFAVLRSSLPWVEGLVADNQRLRQALGSVQAIAQQGLGS